MTQQPKIGLSLSGGSALGLAHIGVLQYFLEHHIPVDCIAGTSAGSLVATLFAFGVHPDEIVKEARALSWSVISNIYPSKLGLLSNRALGERVRALIADARIENASIPLSIVATDIHTGEVVVITHGSAIDAVRASAAIPGMYVPVIINNRMLVDGGLAKNLPYTPLIKMGAGITIGVNVLTGRAQYEPPRTYLDIISNTFSILMHRANEPSRKKFDVLIEPDVSAFTSSDFDKAEALVKAGYDATRTAHPRIVHAYTQKLSWWKRPFVKRPFARR